MTKTIDTLVQDIYHLLEASPKDGGIKVPKKLMTQFSKRVLEMAERRFDFNKENDIRERPTLRISNVGKPCERQVWYGIHQPMDSIPFRGQELVKFMYGDLTEELILFLAEAAGHKVEGQQDRLEVEGVVGHRDAVIDGVLVDVKSASQFAFKKFQEGLKLEDDNFGYIGQLQTYLEGSQDDPIVTNKDRCAFLVFDKTLGHICLDIHERMKDVDIRAITRRKVEVMNSEEIPERRYAPIEDGYTKAGSFYANGNMKLAFQCGYCSFRNVCWPNHRIFLGSKGPLYLTHVEKEPRMVEIDFKGNLINKETLEISG